MQHNQTHHDSEFKPVAQRLYLHTIYDVKEETESSEWIIFTGNGSSAVRRVPCWTNKLQGTDHDGC